MNPFSETLKVMAYFYFLLLVAILFGSYIQAGLDYVLAPMKIVQLIETIDYYPEDKG